jgi:hypothetical protein
MPPKGWKSGRDDTVLKTVRLPEPIMERVMGHVERLQEQLSFVRVTESMALRNLIELGLGVAEGLPRPAGPLLLPTEPEPERPLQTPPAGPGILPQPAIPLAMEPAPKATLSPKEPQVDAPPPPPLVTHETLTPSEEVDQESAPTAELPVPEPPSHLATVEEPEPMATSQPPMAVPQAPAAPRPEAPPDEALIAETPSIRSQRGLPREKLQEIADTAAQYDKLSLLQLAQLLFDRGIYRARDRQTGAEKPVNRGTLQKWLEQAREAGLL